MWEAQEEPFERQENFSNSQQEPFEQQENFSNAQQEPFERHPNPFKRLKNGYPLGMFLSERSQFLSG